MVPIPRRAKSRAAKAVRSYTDILMGLANPQDNSPGYNTNPIRPRKRVAVDIKMSVEETSKEETPPLKNKAIKIPALTTTW